MASWAKRKRYFDAKLAMLYDEDVSIFYTSKMPVWVGSESYWRDHGFKIAPGSQSIGIQPIHSLLLFAPVYAFRDVLDLKGDKADSRRELFYNFHQATGQQQRDWLWHKLLAPQFELSEATYLHSLAQMFNTDEINVVAGRVSLGCDIWMIYVNKQRGRWWAMWRLPKAMSESLDRQFALEVYERYGFEQHDLFRQPAPEQEEVLSAWTDYQAPDDIVF